MRNLLRISAVVLVCLAAGSTFSGCASSETIAASAKASDCIDALTCYELITEINKDLAGTRATAQVSAGQKKELERQQKLCCVDPIRGIMEQNHSSAEEKEMIRKICDEMADIANTAYEAYLAGDYDAAFAIMAENPQVFSRFMELIFSGPEITGLSGHSDAQGQE